MNTEKINKLKQMHPNDDLTEIIGFIDKIYKSHILLERRVDLLETSNTELKKCLQGDLLSLVKDLKQKDVII